MEARATSFRPSFPSSYSLYHLLSAKFLFPNFTPAHCNCRNYDKREKERGADRERISLISGIRNILTLQVRRSVYLSHHTCGRKVRLQYLGALIFVILVCDFSIPCMNTWCKVVVYVPLHLVLCLVCSDSLLAL